jgi:hypothetical protein
MDTVWSWDPKQAYSSFMGLSSSNGACSKAPGPTCTQNPHKDFLTKLQYHCDFQNEPSTMSEPSKPTVCLHQTNPKNRMGWWVNEQSNLPTPPIMCTDNYHSHWQCKTRRQTGAVLLYNLRDLKASTIPVHAYPNSHLIGSPTLPGTITIPHTPDFPTSDPTPTFRPSFILQFFHCGPFQGLIHDNRETPKSINQDSKSDNISIFFTMSLTNP